MRRKSQTLMSLLLICGIVTSLPLNIIKHNTITTAEPRENASDKEHFFSDLVQF